MLFKYYSTMTGSCVIILVLLVLDFGLIAVSPSSLPSKTNVNSTISVMVTTMMMPLSSSSLPNTTETNVSICAMCTCDVKSHRETITCMRLELKNIPYVREDFNNSDERRKTTLKLGHNIITTLSAHRLMRTNLTRVHLQKNEIATIEEDALRYLVNLKQLNLSFNVLAAIHENMFIYNDKLEELDLSHNLIESIDNQTFGHHPKLVMLNLDHNRLLTIQFINKLASITAHDSETGMFHGRKIKLDLRNNTIKLITRAEVISLDYVDMAYFDQGVYCKCHKHDRRPCIFEPFSMWHSNNIEPCDFADINLNKTLQLTQYANKFVRNDTIKKTGDNSFTISNRYFPNNTNNTITNKLFTKLMMMMSTTMTMMPSMVTTTTMVPTTTVSMTTIPHTTKMTMVPSTISTMMATITRSTMAKHIEFPIKSTPTIAKKMATTTTTAKTTTKQSTKNNKTHKSRSTTTFTTTKTIHTTNTTRTTTKTTARTFATKTKTRAPSIKTMATIISTRFYRDYNAKQYNGSWNVSTLSFRHKPSTPSIIHRRPFEQPYRRNFAWSSNATLGRDHTIMMASSSQFERIGQKTMTPINNTTAVNKTTTATNTMSRASPTPSTMNAPITSPTTRIPTKLKHVPTTSKIISVSTTKTTSTPIIKTTLKITPKQKATKHPTSKPSTIRQNINKSITTTAIDSHSKITPLITSSTIFHVTNTIPKISTNHLTNPTKSTWGSTTFSTKNINHNTFTKKLTPSSTIIPSIVTTNTPIMPSNTTIVTSTEQSIPISTNELRHRNTSSISRKPITASLNSNVTNDQINLHGNLSSYQPESKNESIHELSNSNLNKTKSPVMKTSMLPIKISPRPLITNTSPSTTTPVTSHNSKSAKPILPVSITTRSSTGSILPVSTTIRNNTAQIDVYDAQSPTSSLVVQATSDMNAKRQPLNAPTYLSSSELNHIMLADEKKVHSTTEPVRMAIDSLVTADDGASPAEMTVFTPSEVSHKISNTPAFETTESSLSASRHTIEKTSVLTLNTNTTNLLNNISSSLSHLTGKKQTLIISLVLSDKSSTNTTKTSSNMTPNSFNSSHSLPLTIIESTTMKVSPSIFTSVPTSAPIIIVEPAQEDKADEANAVVSDDGATTATSADIEAMPSLPSQDIEHFTNNSDQYTIYKRNEETNVDVNDDVYDNDRNNNLQNTVSIGTSTTPPLPRTPSLSMIPNDTRAVSLPPLIQQHHQTWSDLTDAHIFGICAMIVFVIVAIALLLCLSVCVEHGYTRVSTASYAKIHRVQNRRPDIFEMEAVK